MRDMRGVETRHLGDAVRGTVTRVASKRMPKIFVAVTTDASLCGSDIVSHSRISEERT